MIFKVFVCFGVCRVFLYTYIFIIKSKNFSKIPIKYIRVLQLNSAICVTNFLLFWSPTQVSRATKLVTWKQTFTYIKEGWYADCVQDFLECAWKSSKVCFCLCDPLFQSSYAIADHLHKSLVWRKNQNQRKSNIFSKKLKQIIDCIKAVKWEFHYLMKRQKLCFISLPPESSFYC